MPRRGLRTERVGDRRVDRRHWGGSRSAILIGRFGRPRPSLHEGNEERRTRQRGDDRSSEPLGPADRGQRTGAAISDGHGIQPLTAIYIE